jgi:hypothetical protein
MEIFRKGDELNYLFACTDRYFQCFQVPNECTFLTRDLDEPIQGWYHIEGDDHIVFQMGGNIL